MCVYHLFVHNWYTELVGGEKKKKKMLNNYKQTNKTKAKYKENKCVCTSQLNSESLALVRRKGVVKPAPGKQNRCILAVEHIYFNDSIDKFVSARL